MDQIEPLTYRFKQAPQNSSIWDKDNALLILKNLLKLT